MRRLLANAIKKNRSKLGQQTTHEWDKWLGEQFHEDELTAAGPAGKS